VEKSKKEVYNIKEGIVQIE